MKNPAIFVVVGLIGVIGLQSVRSAGEEATEQKQLSKQIAAMVDAAEKAFEATQASYEAGATNRQQRVAAYLAHRKRMKDLHDKVGALFLRGVAGGEANNYHATQFYLAEAELWLLEEGVDRKAEKNQAEKIFEG